MPGLGVPEIECPNIDKIYWKDDNKLAQKIAFTILFFMTLGLTFKVIANIRILISIRKERKIHKLLFLNVLILILYLNLMVYLGDGTYALFVPGGYLTLAGHYIFYYHDVIWLKFVLAWSYFTWAPLLALGYDINPSTIKKVVRILKIYTVIAIICQITYMNYFFWSNNTCEIFEQESLRHDLFIFSLIVMISTLINNVVFSTCCYMITKKVQELFDFDDQKSIRLLKFLAPLTVVGTIARFIYNTLLFSQSFFKELESLANEPGTPWQYQTLWAIIQVAYITITELLPTLFLLINFSPYVNKKPTNLRDSLNSVSSSLFVPSILKQSDLGSFDIPPSS